MESYDKLSDAGCSLEDLKHEFKKYKKKYDLPDFTELNKVFDVEEIDIDTEFFLRKLRRVISERIAGYLRFVEMVLNPSNAPMFFFTAITKLDNNDKEKLVKIHDTLGKFEINVIALDVDYNEEREVEFIKKAYHLFHEDVKEDLLLILNKLGNGKDKKVKEDNDSYVG